jgi:PelA/Pel-15E family pectate lyase
MAYLAAYRATGDRFYLEAAREAAAALLYGQLKSGGWTNLIDFDPRGKRAAQYRNGKGRQGGRNYSSLDDGITQHALLFLMRADQALKFKDKEVHEAAKTALEALLKAQFANGGFPQGWAGPVASQPVVKAGYPDYDWRTENRIKEYWDLYTLNDDLAGSVADALIEAEAIYDDARCRKALTRLGDFLILSQMPDPQPAWAQQYTYEMRPAWARKFEPPAITGRESQDAIETLLRISRQTGDPKYLAPVPKALAYLKKSLLPDGQLARYYELRTNKPLYMTRKYELTYDDSDVPTHYGFKVASHLKDLEERYEELKAGRRPDRAVTDRSDVAKDLDRRAHEIIRQLDDEGRWISEHDGEALVGQPKFVRGQRYLSSAVFSRNLETLSAHLEATRP